MKLSLDNGTKINLTKRNFLASGGEGDIYVLGQTAYKIYQNPSNMLPLGKIQELAEIKDPNIIRPQVVCFDDKKNAVGYGMRYVSDTYPLVQIFTKAFRERNGLDHDKMRLLIKKLYNRIISVHNAKILIVDLNEMNFLASNKFDEIYGIDTDSYQTPHYPATAIMDSIRDRHTKTFSKESDWFSYAIISFLMFTGIHPYKGKHPKIKDMESRMKQNISVLSKDVRVPHVCYDFSVIPQVYLDWYKAVLQEGKRCSPPDNFEAAIVIQPSVRKVSGSDNFIIEEIMTVKGNIVSIHSHGTNRVLTTTHFYHKPGSEFAVSQPLVSFKNDTDGAPFLAKIKSGRLSLFNVNSRTEQTINVATDALMVANQPMGMTRLYIKSSDTILRVELMGKNLVPTVTVVANILGQATKVFDGVVIQELLGETFISIFPNNNTHSQFHVKELDGFKVVDAKYDNNVVMLVALNRKNGEYTRFVFRFDKNFTTYDLRKVENVPLIAINFVTLDSGVVVCINEDENLEAFSNNIGVNGLRIIDDPILGGDMRLHRLGGRAYFSRNNKLFSIKLAGS